MKYPLLAIALVRFAGTLSLCAQDAPRQPGFEVASIKECKSTDNAPPSSNSPVRLSLGCWPLWRLISTAYGVFAKGTFDPTDSVPPRIDGPAWINSTRYTIDAKAENPTSPAMMRGPMMQSLLEDRFQLKLRREIREVPVYFMTVAKGGLKAPATKEGSCSLPDPTDLTRSYAEGDGPKPWCTLPRIERGVEKDVYDVPGVRLDVFFKLVVPGRPVIDRTGETGLFDIHLELENVVPTAQPGDGAAPDPRGAVILAAIRKQLGLELTPGKGPHEFFVVDHVARPSAN